MIWKAFSAVAIFSLCLGKAAAQENGRPPEPIPEKEWPAWVTAGATLGRMGEFVPGLVRFEVRDRAGPGHLPAFRFDHWPPKQKLSALPAISVPVRRRLAGRAMASASHEAIDVEHLLGVQHVIEGAAELVSQGRGWCFDEWI